MQNKEYRDSYVSANLKNGLAHQIRTNRELRNLSQTELAAKCGVKTKQEAISRLEDPAYGNYSINTLLKIAAALDVALLVKFVPFSKFLIETADKTPNGLYAEEFGRENLYLRQAQVTLTFDRRSAYIKEEKKQLGHELGNYSRAMLEDGLINKFYVRELRKYNYESK